MSFYRNASLDFVAAPALAPAEVQVDAALMEQYNRELANVRHLALLLMHHISRVLSRPRQFLSPKKTKTCDLFRAFNVAVAVLLY